MSDATVVTRTGYWAGLRTLTGGGLVASLGAVVLTTLVAAALRALGVDFEVSDGETIPVSGIGFQTGVFSIVGIVIAAALLRWSSRPTERFVVTAVALTALSLVPPILWGSGAATVVGLVVLHLVAAAVMIPAIAWSLRRAGL